MPYKIDIITEAYGSYKGDDSRHITRIVLIFVFSAFIATYAGDLARSALPAMSLALSVLAGFTFSALFSSGFVTISDLPKPKDESDRLDLDKLSRVSENFRVRARLFLASAVFCLILVLLLTIPTRFDTLSSHVKWLLPEYADWILWLIYHVWGMGAFAVKLLANLIFLEILYLFYRLSESIFSMIETRRKYLRE